MNPRLKALNEGDRLDFLGNDSPKCPHCGRVIDVAASDLYRIYEEGEHEVDCPECDNPFMVSTKVYFSFSTDWQEEL